MLDWLKNINKEHPEFWKKYLSKFDQKSSRFVVLSTQTTGFNLEQDVILSIGAFAVIGDSIYIGDSFETELLQYNYFHSNKLSDSFLSETTIKKIPEALAIESLVEFIGNSTLVGYEIDFDVAIINVALEKINCGRLKNEALDIGAMHSKLNDSSSKPVSLEQLYSIYNLPVTNLYTSAEEAYKTALLFLKLKSRLKIK